MALNFSFLKSLHKASPVAFGAMDMYNEEIIFSSGHAEALLGYTREELKIHSQKFFEPIVHPDDLPKSQEAISKLLATESSEIIECTLRVRKSDGDYLTLLIRDIVFDRGHDDAPLKFATVVQDVTQVAELEKQLNQKLEIIKKINYKNAHELRAPVANILGLMSLMKKEDFKTEINARIFDHLEETVEKLDIIVHEISKEASGNM